MITTMIRPVFVSMLAAVALTLSSLCLHAADETAKLKVLAAHWPSSVMLKNKTGFFPLLALTLARTGIYGLGFAVWERKERWNGLSISHSPLMTPTIRPSRFLMYSMFIGFEFSKCF
jgi:hypothetical protein